MKKLSIFLVVVLLVSSISMAAFAQDDGAGASNGEEQTVFKLGHIANPDTAYDNLANEFKRLVEEKSNGRYSILIYPSGQLGVDRELMESLQIGNVDFAVVTASDINQFVPDMAVQDLPYLFRDWDHVESFLDSDAADEFFKLTDGVNMKTLGFMPRGFRHVTSNVEPIYTPEDLENLKIRVAESEVYIKTFRALGANPQAMAWGEVFTALQQGTIDAHENTIVTTRDYRINEVQKYLSETGHFFAFGALLMNKNLFDGMSEEDKSIFIEAGSEAAKKLGIEQKNDEASAKLELQELGMEFNEVKDRSEFEKLVTPVYDEFLETHNGKYFDAIQAIE